MGIDGRNFLQIRGPKEVLDRLQETHVAFRTNSSLMEDIRSFFFSPDNCTYTRNQPNLLQIYYIFRNAPIYEYLQGLIAEYPQCWMKNEFVSEDGWNGVWIAHYMHGDLEIQEHMWEELTIEDIAHRTDFSKEGLNVC